MPLTIHMCASVDGYIASADGSVEWMNTSDSYLAGVDPLDAAAVADFLASIDCYVMGARTYETALTLGWPYGETPVVVLTHGDRTDERSTVQFCQGDLTALIDGRLKRDYRNIWLVGGAELTRDVLQQDLADELVITVLPTLLGGGTRFFDTFGRHVPLHLVTSTSYRNGVVELHYALARSAGT